MMKRKNSAPRTDFPYLSNQPRVTRTVSMVRGIPLAPTEMAALLVDPIWQRERPMLVIGRRPDVLMDGWLTPEGYSPVSVVGYGPAKATPPPTDGVDLKCAVASMTPAQRQEVANGIIERIREQVEKAHTLTGWK